MHRQPDKYRNRVPCGFLVPRIVIGGRDAGRILREDTGAARGIVLGVVDVVAGGSHHMRRHGGEVQRLFAVLAICGHDQPRTGQPIE